MDQTFASWNPPTVLNGHASKANRTSLAVVVSWPGIYIRASDEDPVTVAASLQLQYSFGES